MTNEILKNERFTTSDESLFQSFFTTNGRINRMTFFGRSLMILFVEYSLLFAICFLAVIASISLENSPLWIDISCIVVLLAGLFPEYCLSVKRLHDIGKDETLAKIFVGIGILTTICTLSTMNVSVILTSILGIASLGFKVYLLFKRGENFNNEYGAAKS